mmetsp:Transcript_5947/g.18949  ORF Transcript_5947/g.18949 Transcript_5947/m.18949 type:complete len:268 (-) Transcript_5947:500-1303(-)
MMSPHFALTLCGPTRTRSLDLNPTSFLVVFSWTKESSPSASSPSATMTAYFAPPRGSVARTADVTFFSATSLVAGANNRRRAPGPPRGSPAPRSCWDGWSLFGRGSPFARGSPCLRFRRGSPCSDRVAFGRGGRGHVEERFLRGGGAESSSPRFLTRRSSSNELSRMPSLSLWPSSKPSSTPGGRGGAGGKRDSDRASSRESSCAEASRRRAIVFTSKPKLAPSVAVSVLCRYTPTHHASVCRREKRKAPLLDSLPSLKKDFRKTSV